MTSFDPTEAEIVTALDRLTAFVERHPGEAFGEDVWTCGQVVAELGGAEVDEHNVRRARAYVLALRRFEERVA
jgi:hypothetical protein